MPPLTPPPPTWPPFWGTPLTLTFNLTNSSDPDESCDAILDASRERWVARIRNATCGIATYVILTLANTSESRPCHAVATLMPPPFQLQDAAACLSESGVGALSVPTELLTPAEDRFGGGIIVVALLCVLMCVYARATHWRRVTVFLSYRVEPDQELVKQLHERLVALGLRVWFDFECLKPGQNWEEGFADGLFASRVFVPVLSKAGLASFADLDAGSRCDNVLLEHLLALEQKDRGRLKAIYPVLVGKLDAATGRHGHFFTSGGMPDCSRHVAVDAVDAKAREHLTRKLGVTHGGTLRVGDRSPRGVLHQLCQHQGGFVQGECDAALDKIARQIQQTVKDVAAGRVIAEAHGAADARASRGGWPCWPCWRAPVQEQQSTELLEPPRIKRPTMVAAVPRGASFAAASDARPPGMDLAFSPVVGKGEERSGGQINPVLVYKAKAKQQRDKQAKTEARRRMQQAQPPGATGGLLRRLMPVLSGKEQPAEVMVDRYLEESCGVPHDARGTARAGQEVEFDLERQRLARTQEARRRESGVVAVRRMRGSTAAGIESMASGPAAAGAGAATSRLSWRGADTRDGRLLHAPSRWAATLRLLQRADWRSLADEAGTAGAGAAGIGAAGNTASEQPHDDVDEVEETAEEAAARTVKRLEQIREAQAAAQAAEEAERLAKRLGPRRVSVAATTFGALKAMLAERGLPKEQLDQCTTKFALVECARSWSGELKIEWADNEAVAAEAVAV